MSDELEFAPVTEDGVWEDESDFEGYGDGDLADFSELEAEAAEASAKLPTVAIVGRPNVGKSTLVNRILGRREAVVEDIPGVTRDRISYEADWAGRRFLVQDTGGWEPDAKGMQQSVAAQAEVAMRTADAVVVVVDATVGATSTDEAVARVLRRSKTPVILAANKVDDQRVESEAAALWSLGLGEPYTISAAHGRGTGDLLDVILEKLPETPREGTGGFGPAAWRWSVNPTWARAPCSTSSPVRIGPWSTTWPAPPSIPSTRSSSWAERRGSSSTPQACGRR